MTTKVGVRAPGDRRTDREVERGPATSTEGAFKAAGLDETHRVHDLRHTFGWDAHGRRRRCRSRTLQEWMGHRDLQTTQIYADYAPSSREADMVAGAFARRGPVRGPILSESEVIS